MSLSPQPSAGKPGRVLVTDGEFKHTLGIVRSLADQGHEVHLLAGSGRAPAVHSRAVTRWHAAPAAGEPSFDARLLAVAGSLAPVSLIPVGSHSMAAADRVREKLPPGVRLAIASRESFAIANDKRRTAELARSLGVRTPAERPAASLDQARAALDDLGMPMVLKSAREEGRKVLRYVKSAAELPAAFHAVRSAAAGRDVIAQERIRGDGFGYSALYWNGARQRAFVHRRVREWPPSGGTSACAASVPHAPEIEHAGGLLLDALQWHGVAMVEFKGSADGSRPALIEINAKFWGSLDVALAAGVDFPGDLAALMEGRKLGPQPPVQPVRFSWPLGGDLWHGVFQPASLTQVLGDTFSPNVAHSFRWNDPAPTLWEALQWARSTPGAWKEHRTLA